MANSTWPHGRAFSQNRAALPRKDGNTSLFPHSQTCTSAQVPRICAGKRRLRAYRFATGPLCGPARSCGGQVPVPTYPETARVPLPPEFVANPLKRIAKTRKVLLNHHSLSAARPRVPAQPGSVSGHRAPICTRSNLTVYGVYTCEVRSRTAVAPCNCLHVLF